MKKLCVLLALLCLAGCTPKGTHKEQTHDVSPPSQPAAYTLYAFENDTRSLAVDMNGQVILEALGGVVSILEEDGRSVGISVMRTEGSTTDEWGWTSPEFYYNDIYDVTGQFRFTLPLSYVSVEYDFFTGYNPKDGGIQFYRRSDGTLCYDKVQTHFAIGSSYFIQLAAKGLLLHEDGTQTEVPSDYTVNYNLSDALMIVTKDGLQGLMDENGDLVLPCRYDHITWGGHGYIFAQLDGDHFAIDTATGETVFSSPHPISSMPTKDCVVVSVDDDYTAYQLVELNGDLITDQLFSWINSYPTADGGDPVLQGTDLGTDKTVLFAPDGTVLYTMDGSGYCNVIDENKVLICQYSDTDTAWSLLDLKSGKEKELSDIPDSYYSQLYGADGAEGYLLHGYTNEQGWYRHDLLDSEGNVLLSDLQDCVYRQNGIVQCRIGFRSGLMRLDGTWLYEESTFSAVDDD